MAFGQQSGPPASRNQLNELVELLQAAGHADFRDARGPMGFSQRQAGGKFTRDEADEFIEQLRAETDPGDDPPTPAEQVRATAPSKSAPSKRAPSKPAPSKPAPTSEQTSPPRAAGDRAALTPAEKQLRRIPTPELAAELQRRGWIVVEP